MAESDRDQSDYEDINLAQERDQAKAIVDADTLIDYVLKVYEDVAAKDLGYKFLLSTMPSEIDEEIFEQMIEIAGKADDKFKGTAAQIQAALKRLRELHSQYPLSEASSIINLSGQMVESKHILLDDPEL